MKRFVLLGLLLLSACAPSAQAIQTALVQTQAAIPTATATATKIATRTPQPTKTLIPTLTQIPRTATMTPVPQTPTPINFEQVGRRDFTTYPDKYTGHYVVISGIVFNINNNKELQVFMGGDYGSPVYVVSSKPYNDIYKDDDVVIYGTANGSNCGNNAFGGSVCQAIIVDACITHHVYINGTVKKNGKGERPTPSYAGSACP